MTTTTQPGYSPSTKAPSAKDGGIACRHKCAGGNKCVSSSVKPHQYHCCKDEACECRERLRKGITSR